jgi:Na+/phosphate symporter
MTYTSRNADKLASTQVSLQCYKALADDYLLRAKQAEEIARQLQTNIDMEHLSKLIVNDMLERSDLLVQHQTRLFELTINALSLVRDSNDIQSIKNLVNTVCEQITRFLNTLNKIDRSKNATEGNRFK